MPDQLKEISLGTYSIGALSDGVPIASTDANTQFVVKDIQVQNNTIPSVGSGVDFVVNGVRAADIDTSVSGSEIIDVSSTAVAVASPAAFTVTNFENWMPISTSNSRINSTAIRAVNGVTAVNTNTQSDAISSPPSAGYAIVSWATIGSNFYYWTDDENSVQSLYRRDGGVNGTQTQIANISSYMPVVFDGVDKFYWVTGSQIYTHNATTNTNSFVNLITTGTSWSSTLSSYPRIVFANGLVFWSNSVGSRAFVINPTTGRMCQINGTFLVSSNSAFAVHLDAGLYTLLYTSSTSGGASGDMLLYTVLESAVGPLTTANTAVTATNVGTVSGYTPEMDILYNWPKKDADGNFIFLDVSTVAPIFTYKRFNMVTRSFVSPVTINMTSVSPNTADPTYAKFRVLTSVDDSANKLNTTFYPQSVTLRVTGVETTL